MGRLCAEDGRHYEYECEIRLSRCNPEHPDPPQENMNIQPDRRVPVHVRSSISSSRVGCFEDYNLRRECAGSQTDGFGATATTRKVIRWQAQPRISATTSSGRSTGASQQLVYVLGTLEREGRGPNFSPAHGSALARWLWAAQPHSLGFRLSGAVRFHQHTIDTLLISAASNSRAKPLAPDYREAISSDAPFRGNRRLARLSPANLRRASPDAAKSVCLTRGGRPRR